MDYFLKAFREFANFSGRERRKDYWMFILIYFLLYVAISLVDKALGSFWLTTIFTIAAFIPSMSFAARRLHDTGRSGWWQLILLIPLIGLVVIIVFLAQDSDKEENAYGPCPKY